MTKITTCMQDTAIVAETANAVNPSIPKIRYDITARPIEAQMFGLLECGNLYRRLSISAILDALNASGLYADNRAQGVAWGSNPMYVPRWSMSDELRARLARKRKQAQERIAADYDRRMTYITHDKASGQAILHKRKPVAHYAVMSPMGDDMPVTDTAHAYMYHAAQVMAMTALKAIEARSGDPYITRIINAAISDRRELERTDGRAITAQGNGCFTSDNDSDSIIYHTEQSAPMQERKHHSRRKVAGMYFPADYDTLENTDTGRKILASEMDTLTVYMDCVHSAYVKLLELAQHGVITDFESVWSFRPLVYGVVNVHIKGQRSVNSQTSTGANILYANENGEEPMKAPRVVDKEIEAIIDGDAVKTILDYVVSRAGNVNEQKFRRVFELYLDGWTQAQIGASVHMKQPNVNRYLDRALDILSTTQGKRFLASLF